MTAVALAAALLSTCIAFWAGWLLARRGREAREAELLVRIEEREVRAREASADSVRAARREAELQIALRSESSRASALEASLQAERRSAEEKAKTFEEMSSRAQEAFKSLSVDALRANMDEFLRVAQLSMQQLREGASADLEQRQKAIADLVAPVRESLDKVVGNVQELEKSRVGAYAALWQQVNALHQDTRTLVTALRAPAHRGRWAEIHLRRVVELTGLSEHCDFHEQVTVAADGSTLRPDMVIRMPAGRSVLVDAKAPLSAYLDAAEAADEATRAARLRDHAAQVKQHIGQLARKAYWERFDESPEFIVMYLPNDALFEAAQQQDPGLLEWALSQNVVIATPATLFALLLTVAHGWKQQKVELNAREIASLGRELHKRISDAAAHLAKLGRQIEGTVRAYNDTVGSLERRALPAARRFEQLHASHADVEIEPLAQLENVPRAPSTPELTAKEVPEDAN
jgi:DNA recombination protein RmuC